MRGHCSAGGRIGTGTIQAALAGPAWALHSIVGWVVTDRGTTSDYHNIADEFNKFFCSIGSNLANNFSNTSLKSFSTYLNKRVSSSIYLNIPNPTEIFNGIYPVKNNKAVGDDNIPAFFRRIASSVIIPYLQVFIEFCYTEGVFPKIVQLQG